MTSDGPVWIRHIHTRALVLLFNKVIAAIGLLGVVGVDGVY